MADCTTRVKNASNDIWHVISDIFEICAKIGAQTICHMVRKACAAGYVLHHVLHTVILWLCTDCTAVDDCILSIVLSTVSVVHTVSSSTVCTVQLVLYYWVLLSSTTDSTVQEQYTIIQLKLKTRSLMKQRMKARPREEARGRRP